MSIEPYFMLKMQRAETQLMGEIAHEQITHPIAEYTPERVARLMEQIDEARRHTWPATLIFNL